MFKLSRKKDFEINAYEYLHIDFSDMFKENRNIILLLPGNYPVTIYYDTLYNGIFKPHVLISNESIYINEKNANMYIKSIVPDNRFSYKTDDINNMYYNYKWQLKNGKKIIDVKLNITTIDF